MRLLTAARLALIAVALSCVPGFAAENPDVVLWRSSVSAHVVDALPLRNGATCLLVRGDGVLLLNAKMDTLESLHFPMNESVTEFLRAFQDPKEDGKIQIVARMQKGLAVWGYNAGEWTLAAQIPEIDYPICYQAANGSIWIHSSEGVIYSISGTQTTQHDYAERVDKSGNSRTYFRDLDVAEAPDGTLCFSPHFGNMNTGKAMDHLLLFRKGDWQKTAYGELNPRGACFATDERLWVASQVGLTDLSVGTELSKLKTVPPPGELLNSYPCYLSRLADGTLVSLWSPMGKNWRSPAYPDGAFSHIAEFSDGKWRVVNQGDYASWDPGQYVRPSVADGDGGFWLGIAGGLLYRSRGGEWLTIDWRRGIACSRPRRLALSPAAKVLWVVDENGACVAVDARRIVSAPVTENNWSLETFLGRVRQRKDGLLCAMTNERGGAVVTIGPKGKEYLDFPGGADRIPPESISSMTLDSEGGVWLFGDNSQQKVEYYDGEKWAVFTRGKDRGSQWRAKEAAFQTLVAKAASFHIGSPEDDCYPVFSGDGRIVYKNEYRRACYFDGKSWHAPYGGQELPSSPLFEHPFFSDGKVTIQCNGKTYQMDEEQWTAETDNNSIRSWKEVKAIPPPFPIKFYGSHRVLVPADCPIDEKDRAWTLESDGRTWVGGDGKIACGFGGGWTVISTLYTPLSCGRKVMSVSADTSGRWLFELADSFLTQYAVYKARTVALERGEEDLGKVDRPSATVTPPWRASVDEHELLCRTRIDDGEWSRFQVGREIRLGAVPNKGTHRLSVEVRGLNELLNVPPLNYSFEVTYDSLAMVADLTTQLGAAAFDKRVNAAKKLLEMGQEGIPPFLHGYDAGDAKIEAGFIPDASEIVLGQPLHVTFFVVNKGKQPLSFSIGGDTRCNSGRHHNFEITAIDSAGQKVDDPYPNELCFGGFANEVHLAAGQTYSERLFVGQWCVFRNPGEYAVSCSRRMGIRGEKGPPIEVKSSLPLRILPSDGEALGKVIDELGRNLREAKDDELAAQLAMALASINDERVIPYLHAALTKGSYRGHRPAVEGLAKFDNQASVEAMLTALQLQDESVARLAAEGLQKIGKIDAAIDTLIKKSAANDEPSRVTAAKALGWTKSKRAFESLLILLHDKAPSVRYAAAEALGTLEDERALEPLKQSVGSDDFELRIAATKGLLAMNQPLQPEWLTPIIRAGNGKVRSYHDAILLLRLHGGDKAAPALASCINFDDPSTKSQNFWLIMAIEASLGGPKYYSKWHSEPNRTGTEQEIEDNKQILKELKEYLDRKR